MHLHIKGKTMEKVINFHASIYQICKQYPEMVDILDEIGFHDIKKPMALNTVGRVMDLTKGAMLKQLSMPEIIKTIESHGFTINYDKKALKTENTEINKPELLKSYIQRLSQGEDLESVKKDFIENFAEVSAKEIANAEQQLILEGMPVQEVQRLCDVHSSLFHGSTKQERINAAEEAVMRSMEEEALLNTEQLIHEEGHPLNILTLENQHLQALLYQIKGVLLDQKPYEELKVLLQKLQTIAVHYMKKDELLFPLLKEKGYPGPSDVMWGVEDDIRKKLSRFVKITTQENFAEHKEELDLVLNRIQEMIYKEENILYPLCQEVITDEEWNRIYHDFPEMGYCLLDEIPYWQNAKPLEEKDLSLDDGVISLPTGKFTVAQLEGVLRTLPVELTFIDKDDITRFYSDQEHFFKRPKLCLDRTVYDCHSPMILPIVKKVISDLKSGKKDVVRMLRPIRGHKILVRYMAVRSKSGEYLGTLEAVEDVTDIEK